MVGIKTEAIFTGANQQNQVSDYNKEREVLAFGAGENIALWNPLDSSHNGIYMTLKGHEADLTCIKFIKGSDFMVSTSEDYQIKIWKFEIIGDIKSWKCIQTIKHYQNSIVALAVLPKLIAVGCANGLVSIWNQPNDDEEFILGNEFEIAKNVLPLSLSMTNVINNKYILAVGGTNVNIFIFSFIFDEDNNKILDCQLSTKLEGHEDWIKSLTFRHQETPGDLLLASGSQDRYIRLWRIRINELIDDPNEDENKLALLNNKQFKFTVGDDLKVAINFDALIMGHDDWISSIQWHETRLQLLAATADTALMIWEPEETSGIWICNTRLGELSSKGASTATGSVGGFWSCIWFNNGDNDYILTNGKTGAWRLWLAQKDGIVEQQLAISGATKEVTDICWSKDGKFLLSTSLDQTTRLFAPWLINADGSKRNVRTWHEFSRPQIHGYNMICCEILNNTRFVSGGDEKIFRSFDEPKGVAEILQKFVDSNINTDLEMPESASVPVLGLSNKATEDVNENEQEDVDELETNDNKNISYDLVQSLTQPPMEDTLQRHLLWPEIEKLYGHGYEITCLAVSPDGKLTASACRSNTAQHSVIRIFDNTSWLELKPNLAFHNLTITRLRFSPDNKYLLSVCRDRQWAVWERNLQDNSFTLLQGNEKPHSKIIWDGDWAPEEFGNVFITASRDKTIKLWRFDQSKKEYSLENSVKYKRAVTAVSILDKPIDNKLFIAVGLENGSIIVYNYDVETGFQELQELDNNITPADKVTRLRWAKPDNIADNELLLASSSSDTTTRIYSILY